MLGVDHVPLPHTHPARVKPELIANQAARAGQVDLLLYCIIDIYSRYVVGWMVAGRESAELAERLFIDTIAKQGVDRGRLTIHADNGSSMASKPVAFLLADLG